MEYGTSGLLASTVIEANLGRTENRNITTTCDMHLPSATATFATADSSSGPDVCGKL
jgi:hypothetical protein